MRGVTTSTTHQRSFGFGSWTRFWHPTRVHLAAKATAVNDQPERLRLARARSLDCRSVARQAVATYGEGMRRLLRGWIWFRVWWRQAPQIN